MFENTLEAQALHLNESKLGTVSVAMLAHAGALAAIAVATALSMPPPIEGPPVPPIVTWIVQPPEAPKSPVLAPKPPGGGGGGRRAPAAPIRPADPIVQPTQTPDVLADVPPTGNEGDDGPSSTGPDLGLDGPPGDPGPGPGGSGTGDGGPTVLTGEMVAPRLLAKVEPVYPNSARRARLPGKVVVEAVIGLDGRVESVRVLSSTSTLFDDAALSAVRLWRYTPATMDGRPVRVYFTVVVSFVIH